MTVRTPTGARRGRRMERIVEAAATLLAERGFHGLSMRDVARAAGTSLANLYHYVGGKEDLLYRVELRLLEAAVASGEAALAAQGGREGLEALVTDHVRRVLARPFEAAVLAGSAGPLRGDRARRVEEARRRYHALVRAAAEAAVRRGRPVSNGEVLASLLLGMADRVALDAVRRGGASTPDRLSARVLALFFGGAARRLPRR